MVIRGDMRQKHFFFQCRVKPGKFTYWSNVIETSVCTLECRDLYVHMYCIWNWGLSQVLTFIHVCTLYIQMAYITVYESEDLAESSDSYTIYVHIVHEIFTAQCYTRVQYSYDTLSFWLWQRNLCPDHIQWNFLKILSRFITLRYVLFGDPTVMVYSKGNIPKY